VLTISQLAMHMEVTGSTLLLRICRPLIVHIRERNLRAAFALRSRSTGIIMKMPKPLKVPSVTLRREEKRESNIKIRASCVGEPRSRHGCTSVGGMHTISHTSLSGQALLSDFELSVIGVLYLNTVPEHLFRNQG
jgi:hypothetical protein